jgi:hypothetical protein
VASGGPDVGFFVQYAERSNPNVKLLQERTLRTVPSPSRAGPGHPTKC